MRTTVASTHAPVGRTIPAVLTRDLVEDPGQATAMITLLRAADARIVPWKNGRGVTREIAVGPVGASFERGDFDWRISATAVPDDGAFSAFPGIDRVIVVTSGDGFDLDHGAAAQPACVRLLEPYAFSGDWPTRATLRGGPVTDFNVLTRRGRAGADVRVLRAADPGPLALPRPEVGSAGVTFVHALRGPAVLRRAGADGGDASPFSAVLSAGDTLAMAGTDVASDTWTIDPGTAADGVLICVRLTFLRE